MATATLIKLRAFSSEMTRSTALPASLTTCRALLVLTEMSFLSTTVHNPPWQDCAADLLGPLPTGESILVVVDYYSRFLEVAILKSTTRLKGKTYADLKRGATAKNIRVGDTVLLRADKTNKLSTNFNPAPFEVIQKTGREVTLRNETGVELKRNTAFVKKYNEQDDVSRGNGNGHQEVQAESMVQAEDSGPKQNPRRDKSGI